MSSDREKLILKLKVCPVKRCEVFKEFCKHDDAADIIYLLSDAHINIGKVRLNQVTDPIWEAMADKIIEAQKDNG